MYTLHDPTVGSKTTSLQEICSSVDRHTRFRIFLSSLFYVGHAKERTTDRLLKDCTSRNPRRTDRLEAIRSTGCQAVVNRFGSQLTKEQARHLELLVLSATRFGGHLTNLQEVEVEEGEEQQLAGVLVLWEASLTLGMEE